MTAGCQGKQAFETFDNANKVNRHHADGKRRRYRIPYRCPTCRKFHLASPRPQKGKLQGQARRQEE